MYLLQLALIGLVVVVAGAWYWFSQRQTVAVGATKEERLDTVAGWPPQATRVLTAQELKALDLLQRALPEYTVLSQVPLSRFVSVSKRNSYADWLRRVGYQCVDFVIADASAQVVGVVELQHPMANDRSRKRTRRIARTLEAAEIRFHVWAENALPGADVARQALLPIASSAKPASKAMAPVATAASAAPAAPANPFDDENRDSGQDEVVELLEPPPSTWFDDLDSGHVPLRKH